MGILGSKMETDQFVTTVILIIFGIVLWTIISKGYYGYVRRMAKRRANGRRTENKSNTTAIHFVFSIVRMAITLGIILMILQVQGVNITSTIAGLGLASAIVGLALQDTMKDIIAGINLMSDQFYDVEDVIEYQPGHFGEVISFTLRSTKVRDIDDGSIYTSFNGVINSMKKVSGVQFIDLMLPYELDYEKANDILTKVIGEIEQLDIIKMCSYKGLQDLGEYALIYRLKIVSLQAERPDARRAALDVVKRTLDKAGISIPYDQLDVHICDNGQVE